MAEILTAVLIATAVFLLVANAFFFLARVTGRDRIAHEVARTLARYTWTLRLGGEDRDQSQHRRHA
jgi:hypothetical protein